MVIDWVHEYASPSKVHNGQLIMVRIKPERESSGSRSTTSSGVTPDHLGRTYFPDVFICAG